MAYLPYSYWIKPNRGKTPFALANVVLNPPFSSLVQASILSAIQALHALNLKRDYKGSPLPCQLSREP